MSETDRIEKSMILRAPVSRVWRALVDAKEFGAWFGCTIHGDFVEGAVVRASFAGEVDEAAIMRFQAERGLVPSKIRLPGPNAVFCTVVRVEPERRFAFRWVPYGIDAEADPENEPTTFVEFTLEAVPEGTRLTVVESGFDEVPAHRRARALRMNEGGWAAQLGNVCRHVEAA